MRARLLLLLIAVAASVAVAPRADARRPAARAKTTSAKKARSAAAPKADRATNPNAPAGTANAGSAGDADSTAEAATTTATTTGGKTLKTRTYTFGALDVEGKLKTPQLLYFLDRVKLELEMSAPDKRSFMKELEKTADDSNL